MGKPIKYPALWVLIFFLVHFLLSCTPERAQIPQMLQGDTERDYTYFAGRKLAMMAGTLAYMTAEQIGANTVSYSDVSAAAEDVRRGRVDGYIYWKQQTNAIA